MSGWKRIGAGIAAGAIVAVLAVAAAPAGESFPSRVTIRHDTSRDVERLAGRVESERYRCRYRRLVLVFRWEKGEFVPAGDEAYDLTNTRGRWWARAKEATIPPGEYIARVTRKRIAAGLCEGDRSRRLTVE